VPEIHDPPAERGTIRLSDSNWGSIATESFASPHSTRIAKRWADHLILTRIGVIGVS
jgi:hypothetical protein